MARDGFDLFLTPTAQVFGQAYRITDWRDLPHSFWGIISNLVRPLGKVSVYETRSIISSLHSVLVN